MEDSSAKASSSRTKINQNGTSDPRNTEDNDDGKKRKRNKKFDLKDIDMDNIAFDNPAFEFNEEDALKGDGSDAALNEETIHYSTIERYICD